MSAGVSVPWRTSCFSPAPPWARTRSRRSCAPASPAGGSGAHRVRRRAAQDRCRQDGQAPHAGARRRVVREPLGPGSTGSIGAPPVRGSSRTSVARRRSFPSSSDAPLVPSNGGGRATLSRCRWERAMQGPPFRADHVGSFLRPAPLVEARAQRTRGRPQRRGAAFDRGRAHPRGRAPPGSRGSVRHHRWRVPPALLPCRFPGAAGRREGHVRRLPGHVPQGRWLGGRLPTADHGGRCSRPPRAVHPGRDFAFLAGQVSRLPKVCIPAPSMLHFRGGRAAIDSDVYPDLEAFFDDLTAAYRDEIADLVSRGCRYIQMDDTNLAYLCDPAIRARTAERGDDPDELTRRYVRLVNDAFRDRPDDMVAAIHLCRGNFKSAWVAEGGYEPVAEYPLQRDGRGRLLPGVRRRAVGGLRAAALRAPRQARRAGSHELEAGGGRIPPTVSSGASTRPRPTSRSTSAR